MSPRRLQPVVRGPARPDPVARRGAREDHCRAGASTCESCLQGVHASRRADGPASAIPVFLCGGVTGVQIEGDFRERDSTAVLNGELYDPGIDWRTGSYEPARERWTTVEAARVVRNYHSVALLTPSGRVWTAGSNKSASQTNPNDRDAPSRSSGGSRPRVQEPHPTGVSPHLGLTCSGSSTNEIFLARRR